jgi:hypothetical protein
MIFAIRSFHRHALFRSVILRVAAQRPSKDDGRARCGPPSFEARVLRTLAPQDDGERFTIAA